MKYPVITIDFIPYGFKHSSVCEALHIDYVVNNDSYNEYMEYAKKQVFSYLEGIFIATSPSLIKDDKATIIIFRSNMDKHTLTFQLKKILQEVKYYTNNEVSISYGLDKVMLLQSNQTANMFQIHKIGETYTKHEVYTEKNNSIEDKLDNKNVNVLLSMEQYK